MQPRRWAVLIPVAALVTGALALHSQSPARAAAPQFDSRGRLMLPKDYREWIFLSSGLGMTYGAPETNRQPNFDDVFVSPPAYREFVNAGHWPEHTVFILEQRRSSARGSVNGGSVGHYQSDLIGLSAAVKDSRRSPDGSGWAYFGFGLKTDPAPALPKTAACYSCHGQNAAVENTFVQFYPTLLPVARAKGTLKPNFRKVIE